MSVDLKSIWEDSEEFDLQEVQTVLMTEFRPHKYKYEAVRRNTNSDIKFREYLKREGKSDYRADFALLNPLWFEDYKNYPDWSHLDIRGLVWGLVVELDGSGGRFSHQGAGAERDRKKNVEFLLEGLVTIRFTVQTVRNSPDYVTYEIYKLIKYFDLDKVE